LKDDILAWSNSDSNNGSSQSTYYIDTATISVGSKIYRFTNWVDVNVDGLRFHNDFGDEGYKIVEWLDGVAQQVWTIGNLNSVITDGSDGFDVVAQNITTTTTFAGQGYKRLTNQYSFNNNGTQILNTGNYIEDEQGLYCALVDTLNVGDPLVNSRTGNGSTRKYFGKFQVGTQLYSWQEQIMVNLNGFFIFTINDEESGYDGTEYLMVEVRNGIVQKIVNVGTYVFTWSDGNIQGEIYTNNEFYGTCS
jgi:hypothetical protein